MAATTKLTSGIPLADPINPNKPVGKKELDKSDFMTLFITQLQYQDPMKPMESHEMAAQLAQFSNMEATMKMANNMEKLLDYQTSQNNLQLLSLIDQEVRAQGDTIGMNGGTPSRAFFDLKEVSDTCTVNIYAPGGRQIKSIEMGYVDTGLNEVPWDGTDFRGEKAPDGPYTFSVVAMTPNGQRAEVQTQSVGKVTGVSFDKGTALLRLDNQAAIGVGDVMEVLQKNQIPAATDKSAETQATPEDDPERQADRETIAKNEKPDDASQPEEAATPRESSETSTVPASTASTAQAVDSTGATAPPETSSGQPEAPLTDSNEAAEFLESLRKGLESAASAGV